MNKDQQLSSAAAVQAERLLAARLSGDAKSRLRHAFRLSSAALAEEPDEWPSQIAARLQNDKDPRIKRVLAWIEATRKSGWLKPVRTPLIEAGGPIDRIIDVSMPSQDSASRVWSKDRKTLTSFFRTTFQTLDLNTEREILKLDLPIGGGRGALSDPLRCAVIANQQRQLLLVNIETAKADVIFSEDTIESVAISADGDWAVITSVPPDWDYFEHDWNGPRTLRLFDLRRKSCVRTWQAHSAVVKDLALSADGRFLATASKDRTACLFDVQTGIRLGCWRSTRELSAIALTPNGSRIAYSSDGGMLTVRAKDGKILERSRQGRAEPGCLVFGDDGNKVVAAGDGGWISVVDVVTSKTSGPFFGTQPYLTSLVIDGSARHAITGENGRQLVQWDLRRRQKIGAGEESISGIWASCDKALVHQDGLWLWDLASGTRTAIRPPGSYEVASAPTAGVWAVLNRAMSRSGSIRIGKWGRQQTTLLYKSNDLSVHFWNKLQISRNGKRLVVSLHPLGCRVLDVDGGGAVWQDSKMEIGVRPHLSPSGRYLLLCSMQGPLKIVDLDTQDTIQRSLPAPNVGDLVFGHDDDSFLVQQGEDTALMNWRTDTIRTLFPGSPSSISDDGRWLVNESNRRKLTLWMLPEERRVATFTLDAPIAHTALSPDGRFLTAGDKNGNFHILESKGYECENYGLDT